MAKLLAEEEATGKAAEVYADIMEKFGVIPNLFKAQAAVDPEWLELNWNRTKHIMLGAGGLDRKTRELIAFAVCEAIRGDYCARVHETMALDAGATEHELTQVKQIIELFCSFSSMADTLRVPCDGSP